MSDGTETEQPMSEATAAEGAQVEGGDAGAEAPQPAQTVPQAEVDRIVRERVARERAKFADYDDLKAKAEGSKTLEQRLAELETELTTTRTQALKTSIAARFGISTEASKEGEASDADLFLTGSDEATLTAQAQRLAERVAAVKKAGNVAPNEGGTKSSGSENGDTREFVGSLFNNSAD